MYLSELELQGFKSFANKTSVKFDSGITAIVGPNGCGKSNIVDALRWVLGEQRASLLRSSAMQNVIFNGTSQKKAMGMAEVSVTIENNRGILPLEYSEVTISRRLYRSGESEYLLNGSVCRLRDIIDLFMDTGMGPGAYSVIELKMVEEILADKNNDRRRLFEEAAGVTRYKEKRRLTLKKLDDTTADLLRVEDILVEIKKKTRSLQIQAGKARRAKEYSEQLEQLDLAWSKYEYQRIQDELNPLMEQMVKAEKEKKDLLQEYTGLEEEEQIAREKLNELESELNKAQQHMNRVHAAVRENETSIRINKEKIENEKQVIVNFERDINQSESDITDLKRSRVSAEKILNERKEALAAAAEELDKHRETYKGIDLEVTELRRKVEHSQKEQESVSNQINEIRSRKIRLESRRENVDEDLERIRKQREENTEQLEISQKDIEILEGQLKVFQKRRDQAAEKLDRLREEKEACEEQINTLRDHMRELQSGFDSAKNELELLDQIARSHDTFPGSVQFLLKNASEFKRLQVVTDVLSAGDEYAVALEAALGEVCNFVVVNSTDEAGKAFDKLRDSKKGRASVIALDLIGKIKPVVHPDSIAAHVDCKPEFEHLRDVLLGQICLAEDLQEAREKITEQGITAVTPAGDVVTSHGVIKSGSKEKNIGIRVGLKDRIARLEKNRDKLQADIESTRKQIDGLNTQRSKLNEQEAREKLNNTESELRRAEQRLGGIQSQKELYEQTLSDLDARVNSLQQSSASADEEMSGLEPEIEKLNYRLEEIIEEQLRLRNALREKDESRQRSQISMNDARVKEQRLRSEAESYEREVGQAANSIQTIKERLDQRAEQAKQSREKIRSLTAQTGDLEEQLEHLKTEKRIAEEKLKESEEDTGRQRGKIRSIEDRLKQLHRRKDVNTELLHQLEIRQSKLDMQSRAILDHVWETYGKMIEQIDAEFPEDTDPGTVKSTISDLRERLKSIGEVNPLAIQEYEEEQERLEFYETQISDLQEAEQKLRSTIKEINQTAHARFSETFEQIRSNFKRVFSMLFQEDDFCDLVLEEKSDDPLDQKIGIIAKPRGKRPSNIEQLSGGEKTLTAIALLFAIYLVKPSPFCILDEVDAPLDDANVERFTGLIRQFSSETQFIVITHNKKTMDKSEVMYGVTMQETGISRLVGVRLDEAKAAS